MLKHFDKLNTPIKSVGTYPTLGTQRHRFQSRGWEHVDVWDLWEVWLNDEFVTSEDRTGLDSVEPFDEWEELMLFGRHYCLLHAKATAPESHNVSSSIQSLPEVSASKVEVVSHTHSKPVRRRFGNAMALRNVEGQRYAAHIMGLGKDSRADTYDLYSLGSSKVPFKLPLHGPSPRMCSELTSLGDYGTLLSGGRASPSKAFSDCWIFNRSSNGMQWEKTWDLPVALFRHSSLRLGDSSLVLVMGGKTDQSRASEACFIFHPEKGWSACQVVGDKPKAAFGSVICNSTGTDDGHSAFTGFRFGGMLQDGTLCQMGYAWTIAMQDGQVFYRPTFVLTRSVLTVVCSTLSHSRK